MEAYVVYTHLDEKRTPAQYVEIKGIKMSSIWSWGKKWEKWIRDVANLKLFKLLQWQCSVIAFPFCKCFTAVKFPSEELKCWLLYKN